MPDLSDLGRIENQLDGPVDTGHPCFGGAHLEELPTLVPKTGPSEHGTHVTSLLLGQPGTQVVGVTPACRGLIVPVFTQRTDGHLAPCSQIAKSERARGIVLRALFRSIGS